MECRLYDIITLGNKPASGNLILGEVLQFHINESILTETNQVDPYKLDPIARNGGSWYTEAKKGLFELKKPNNMGIGFDDLPEEIRGSKYFSGNQLARLASVEKIPIKKNNQFSLDLKGLYLACAQKIDQNKIDEAWQLIFEILDHE